VSVKSSLQRHRKRSCAWFLRKFEDRETDRDGIVQLDLLTSTVHLYHSGFTISDCRNDMLLVALTRRSVSPMRRTFTLFLMFSMVFRNVAFSCSLAKFNSKSDFASHRRLLHSSIHGRRQGDYLKETIRWNFGDLVRVSRKVANCDNEQRTWPGHTNWERVLSLVPNRYSNLGDRE